MAQRYLQRFYLESVSLVAASLSKSRLPLLQKRVGRISVLIGLSFFPPKPRTKGVLSESHSLIGLVRHNACPYGSAPRIGARPQPRVR